jgi:hypothetical protein
MYRIFFNNAIAIIIIAAGIGRASVGISAGISKQFGEWGSFHTSGPNLKFEVTHALSDKVDIGGSAIGTYHNYHRDVFDGEIGKRAYGRYLYGQLLGLARIAILHKPIYDLGFSPGIGYGFQLDKNDTRDRLWFSNGLSGEFSFSNIFWDMLEARYGINFLLAFDKEPIVYPWFFLNIGIVFGREKQ